MSNGKSELEEVGEAFFATACVFSFHHGGAATVILACENSIFLLHTTAGQPLKMQG